MSSKVTPSGVVTDDQTGKRYVPSSIRPDGTKRKEIRIRPGYQLEEGMERYKCPARREAKRKLQEQDQLSPVQTCDSIDTKSEVGKTASSKDLDLPPTSTRSKTGIWTATLSHRSAKSSTAEQNLRTAGKTKKVTTARHRWPKHSVPPQHHQPGDNVQPGSAISNENAKCLDTSRHPEVANETGVAMESRGVEFGKKITCTSGNEMCRRDKKDSEARPPK